MRAQTIITMSRRRRSARRRRALALALGVCALAIPATASASPVDNYSSVNATTGAPSESSEPIDGWSYSTLQSNAPKNKAWAGLNAGAPPANEASGSGGSPDSGVYTSPNAILGSDGLGEPTATASGSPTATGEGFDWASAVLGAGAAMALIALGGAAVLTFRRRTTIEPSAPAG
jgi:hypothetical protein